MSGRRNLAVAHVGCMTWDPPEVRCRGCMKDCPHCLRGGRKTLEKRVWRAFPLLLTKSYPRGAWNGSRMRGFPHGVSNRCSNRKKRPIRGRETGATSQPGREDGRQSTPYDPNHGTSTTRTARTRAPDARHLGERNGMKKILEDMIIKWHQCGYSVEEIHQSMPQVTIDQIRATIIHRHEAWKRAHRLRRALASSPTSLHHRKRESNK